MKIVFFALAFILPGLASARIIRVSKDGSGDYKTVYEGLVHAASGDEVWADDVGRVGASIEKEEKSFLVKAVLPGSGADNAGLKAGDRILLINDRDVAPMTIDQAVAAMRGRPGETLGLHVQKSGDDEARRVVVARTSAHFQITDDISKASVARGVGDFAGMMKFLRGPAEKGNLQAQSELAFDNAYGLSSGKPDESEGARWARIAANNGGGVEVQRLWGWILSNGRGTKKDTAEGLRWLYKAAEGGDGWASYEVGNAYWMGSGVPKNWDTAKSWYQRALASSDASVHSAAQGALDLLKKNAASAEDPRSKPVALPSAPQQQGLTRDEIRQMMAEAMREQNKKPEAAPEKTSDVDKPNYSKKERADDVAVVIGIEKYASLPDASYAEHDAEAVRAHLLALGFPERNIFSLIGPQATKSAFTKELETRLKKLAKPDSTVFVYYSGHGAPDPRSGAAYLVPYDGDPEFLDDTAYPLKRLYAKLGALKAKRVIVALDSCFSGAGGRSVLAKGARPLVNKIEAVEPAGPVAALTAASGGEISGADEEHGHGLFTYYFLKGLNDGDMNLGALHGFLKSRVADEARRHNRDQTPQLIGAGAQGARLDQ